VCAYVCVYAHARECVCICIRMCVGILVVMSCVVVFCLLPLCLLHIHTQVQNALRLLRPGGHLCVCDFTVLTEEGGQWPISQGFWTRTFATGFPSSPPLRPRLLVPHLACLFPCTYRLLALPLAVRLVQCLSLAQLSLPRAHLLSLSRGRA